VSNRLPLCSPRVSSTITVRAARRTRFGGRAIVREHFFIGESHVAASQHAVRNPPVAVRPLYERMRAVVRADVVR
jgi:hypothetical protein